MDVDAAERNRRRKRSARLYDLRNYPPEEVVDAVVRAVVRNQAVVPVTPEALGTRFMSRTLSEVSRKAGRVEPWP